MEIVRCANSHFYDAEKYSSCPICAGENGGKKDIMPEIIDTTYFADPVPVTIPDNNSKIDDIDRTMPISPISPVTPSNYTGPEIEDYGSTQPANVFDMDTASPNKGIFNPVVGWLVCIKGASRGADFQIHSQYNYIGRAKHMDICIPTDPHISAEKAAVLAYDNNDKTFFFSPGSGHNLVRINGSVVMSPVVLKAYDVLTIGETQLLFVPLCGDHFDWNNQ